MAQPYRGGWLSRLVGGVDFGQQQRRVLFFTYLTIKFDRINHKNLIDLLVSIMSLSQILINFSSKTTFSVSQLVPAQPYRGALLGQKLVSGWLRVHFFS